MAEIGSEVTMERGNDGTMERYSKGSCYSDRKRMKEWMQIPAWPGMTSAAPLPDFSFVVPVIPNVARVLFKKSDKILNNDYLCLKFHDEKVQIGTI